MSTLGTGFPLYGYAMTTLSLSWSARLLFAERHGVMQRPCRSTMHASVPPVRSAFPGLREGLAAFASKHIAQSAGIDARLLGAGLLVVWLVAIGAALCDLWRGVQVSAPPEGWRACVGLALRLIPLRVLLTVPWTVEHFSGHAFSLRARGLAMIDILAGSALVAAIEAAAAAVRAHRVLSRQVRPRITSRI